MPTTRSSWPALGIDYLAALTLAVLWGSIVQTQFNLAALSALGAEIDLATRLSTTGRDLLGFTPVYAALIAGTLLVALPVAAGLTRLLPRFRLAWFFLAAGVGAVLTIRLVDAVVPMPTLIAATRGWAGLLTMIVGVAAAGVLFAMLSRPSVELTGVAPQAD